MHTYYSTRYAIHPDDSKTYDTAKLRKAYLIEDLFQKDTIQLTYTLYDRYIIGGVNPVDKALLLETFPTLRAEYFLDRREIGIFNVGANSSIIVDGKTYPMATNEALYIGRGAKEVVFNPSTSGEAHFYFNSAPAHQSYPTTKVKREQAEAVELGAPENANHRILRKMLVSPIIQTCQLQMGITELQTGSVWNTMPAHTHDRRMEVYFYFNLTNEQTVCHFMGEAEETRHIFVHNKQAIVSPPWSIHSGAGTSNYSFIWGMAGENLDYGDMDKILLTALK